MISYPFQTETLGLPELREKIAHSFYSTLQKDHIFVTAGAEEVSVLLI